MDGKAPVWSASDRATSCAARRAARFLLACLLACLAPLQHQLRLAAQWLGHHALPSLHAMVSQPAPTSPAAACSADGLTCSSPAQWPNHASPALQLRAVLTAVQPVELVVPRGEVSKETTKVGRTAELGVRRGFGAVVAFPRAGLWCSTSHARCHEEIACIRQCISGRACDAPPAIGPSVKRHVPG